MKRFVPIVVVALVLATAVSSRADMKPATRPTTTTAAAASPPPAAVDSLALLEKAVAKDSTKFDNLYRLGIMYLDRERMAEATTVFRKANQLRPKDLKPIVNLGIALDAVGHADEAQSWYNKALELSPSDSVAMCHLASSKYAQGKYDDAIGLLRKMIKDQPKSYCAYFTMGVAFADAGIYRDAIRMWHKVIELAPTSPEAQSAKESVDVLEKFLQGK